MIDKKILVISWFFPPVTSSEGLVTYKLLKSSKYSYDVFTQKNNALWSYGNKDDLPKCNNINPIFAESDNLHDWMHEAIEYYKNNKRKYDIVMTRSMPEESHTVGLEIKKMNENVFWIASFGDPIGKNPYVLEMLNKANPYRITGIRSIFSPKRIIKSYLFKKSKKYNYNMLIKKKCKLESEVVTHADKIILNNEYQRAYMANYSKNYDQFMNKSSVIEHSYDKQLYTDFKKSKSTIVFRFIGHLDDIRSPLNMLKAIEILKQNDTNLEEKVSFEFYGDLSDNDKLFIINNDLLDIVKIKKPVGYIESLSLMKSSDWLIHIDANINAVTNDNIFFAAKLADYIGSENNIIGITMLTGASADILRAHNKLCVTNCVSEIVNYLYKIIYQNYQLPPNYNYDELSSATIAHKFDELIEKIN